MADQQTPYSYAHPLLSDSSPISQMKSSTNSYSNQFHSGIEEAVIPTLSSRRRLNTTDTTDTTDTLHIPRDSQRKGPRYSLIILSTLFTALAIIFAILFTTESELVWPKSTMWRLSGKPSDNNGRDFTICSMIFYEDSDCSVAMDLSGRGSPITSAKNNTIQMELFAANNCSNPFTVYSSNDPDRDVTALQFIGFDFHHDVAPQCVAITSPSVMSSCINNGACWAHSCSVSSCSPTCCVAFFAPNTFYVQALERKVHGKWEEEASTYGGAKSFTLYKESNDLWISFLVVMIVMSSFAFTILLVTICVFFTMRSRDVEIAQLET